MDDNFKLNTPEHAIALAEALNDVAETGNITLSITDAKLAARALRTFAPTMTPCQASTAARGRYDSLPITTDDVLAAARSHAKYLRTVSPRDYQMRIFEDGSVYFRNTENPGCDHIISLDDVRVESGDFRLNPHRAFWQHIFAIWA
jgi:hypothetical protein